MTLKAKLPVRHFSLAVVGWCGPAQNADCILEGKFKWKARSCELDGLSEIYSLAFIVQAA